MANAKQSAAWKREAAKRQGSALVVSVKKKPAKKTIKKTVKKDLAAKFCKLYQEFTPVGTIYYEPFIGPVKITKIEKFSTVAVKLTIIGVLGYGSTGEIEVRERIQIKYNHVKSIDIKKMLKEINSLYKKTYF